MTSPASQSSAHELPDPEPSRSYLQWIAPALLIVATVCAFWPVANCDFVYWDDQHTVWRNPAFNPPSPGRLIRYWTWAAEGLYVPVTYSVWFLIAELSPAPQSPAQPFQLNPAHFHVANLLFHVLSVLLVWLIIRRVLQRDRTPANTKDERADWAACAAALLFALHPLQVEAVAWVSGLKDVLACFFSLFVIWQYLKFVEEDPESSDRKLRYGLVLVGTCAAVFSKPSAIVLPVVLYVLDVFILRRPQRTVLRSVAGVFLCCLPQIVVAPLFQHGATELALWQRPILVFYTLSFYVTKLIWPVNLVLDYSTPPEMAMQSRWIAACWVIPLAFAAALWWSYRARRSTFTGLLIFLISVLPILGFVPFMYQSHSCVADHYLYFAMSGLALVLADTLARIRVGVGARVAWTLWCAIVVALGIMSSRQTLRWKNTFTLFTYNTQVIPWSWKSYSNLGAVFLERNKPALAEQNFRTAIAIKPSAEIYAGLASSRLQQNALDDAIKIARQALELSPRYADPHVVLAEAYFRMGQRDEALTELNTAVEIEPNNTNARLVGPRIRASKRRPGG